MPLNFLTPYLLEAFDDTPGTVEIEQTLLVWDSRRSSLDLRVRALTFKSPRGGTALTLPETNITLSIADLMKGELAVTELEVLDASLTLLRLRDGRLAGLQPRPDPDAPREEAAPDPEGGTQQSAFLLIDQLLSDDGGEGPLSRLQAIRLLEADVVLDDRKQGMTWNFPAREILLRRDQRGLSGNADLTIELDGEQASVNLVFVYSKSSDLLDLSLRIGGVNLAKLPDILPELSAFRAVEARASGAINATIGRGSELMMVDFDLSLSRGTLWLGDVGQPPVAFSGGKASGLYDLGQQSLDLQRASLHLGTPETPGPRLEMSGRLQPAPEGAGEMRLDASVAIDSVEMAELAPLWPAQASPNGRTWVLENIPEGRATDLKAKASLVLGEDARLLSLTGGFAYQDLVVHYLRPMPPVAVPAGTASFDAKSLSFEIPHATIGALAFAPVTVLIDHLDAKDQTLQIRSHGHGPIPDLLALLDHPRLGLLKKLGLDPSGSAGAIDFSLGFDFPLEDDLLFEQVEIHSEARLQGLKLSGVVAGQDITAEQVAMTVDSRSMTLKGEVDLAGSRFQVDWAESFTDSRKSRLQAISQSLSAQTVVLLVPDLQGQLLSGAMGATLVLTGNPPAHGAISADLDLAGAALALPYLDWDKKQGAAATAKLKVEFDKGNLVAIEDLAVAAEGTQFLGRVGFHRDGSLAEVRLQQAVFKGYDLRNLLAVPEGAGWRVSVGGGTVDARGLLDEVSVKGPDVEESEVPITIEQSHLDRIVLPGGSLDQASFSGQRGPEGIERLSLAGNLVVDDASSRFEFTLQPDQNSRGRLNLSAGNMGATFKALNISDSVVGGELQINLAAKESGAGAAMSGTVEGKNFRMVGAPILAKVLLVATLTGIGDALDREGIPFERLTGDITIANGVLSSELLRAYGGSLGITAKGNVNFIEDVIQLQGTVVPAYSINRVLGQIPIIGWILTGGEGGGILAVTYSVSGSVRDPQVSVNPLSALTPGFLRGLFDLFEGGEAGEEPPPSLYPEGPKR